MHRKTHLKIGKATVPRSAICTWNENTIVVRGADLAQDLIGQINFGDYFFLLLTGRRADAATSAVLNATLVSIAEHGLVPSVQAARMTLAAARAIVAERRASKLPIPGYGHPEHKARDPRVDALFNVSLKAGGGQRFVEIAKAVEAVIPEIVGKELKLNVSGAIPAVLLGVGFPVNALKGVPMLAHTASLIAHLNEELSDPIGFALSYQATRDQQYTGDMPVPK